MKSIQAQTKGESSRLRSLILFVLFVGLFFGACSSKNKPGKTYDKQKKIQLVTSIQPISTEEFNALGQRLKDSVESLFTEYSSLDMYMSSESDAYATSQQRDHDRETYMNRLSDAGHNLCEGFDSVFVLEDKAYGAGYNADREIVRFNLAPRSPYLLVPIFNISFPGLHISSRSYQDWPIVYEIAGYQFDTIYTSDAGDYNVITGKRYRPFRKDVLQLAPSVAAFSVDRETARSMNIAYRTGTIRTLIRVKERDKYWRIGEVSGTVPLPMFETLLTMWFSDADTLMR